MGHEESLHQISEVCHCRRDTRSCRFVWKVLQGGVENHRGPGCNTGRARATGNAVQEANAAAISAETSAGSIENRGFDGVVGEQAKRQAPEWQKRAMKSIGMIERSGRLQWDSKGFFTGCEGQVQAGLRV